MHVIVFGLSVHPVFQLERGTDFGISFVTDNQRNDIRVAVFRRA